MARTVCISWLICKASQNGIVVKNAERCSIQKQIYFSIPQNYRSHADLRHFEQHNNLKGTSAQHLSELSLQINPRKLFCVRGWCDVVWCGVMWCCRSFVVCCVVVCTSLLVSLHLLSMILLKPNLVHLSTKLKNKQNYHFKTHRHPWSSLIPMKEILVCPSSKSLPLFTWSVLQKDQMFRN